MAIPMLSRKSNGAAYESSSTIIATSESTTATPTYLTSSLSHNFLRSSTRELMPDMYASLVNMPRMVSTALSVSSDEVEESKNTTSMDASGLLMLCCTTSGSISSGTDGSINCSRFITVSTLSTASMSFASADTSSVFIFSTITMENPPLPNSSSRTFCPCTVSISSGR